MGSHSCVVCSFRVSLSRVSLSDVNVTLVTARLAIAFGTVRYRCRCQLMCAYMGVGNRQFTAILRSSATILFAWHCSLFQMQQVFNLTGHSSSKSRLFQL